MGILYLILIGFFIGAAARWAVPGPDPMPFWLTVVIGQAGWLIGLPAADAVVDVNAKDPTGDDLFAVLIAAIIVASLIVILYRHFIQKRPVVGPEARQPPTRGLGIDRLRGRARTVRMTKQQVLDKLDELHDQGALTDEEYVEKRRQVLRQG